MRRGLIASVLVLSGVMLAAQAKPDFSGTWQLDRTRSTGGGGAMTTAGGGGGGGMTSAGSGGRMGGGGGVSMTPATGAAPTIEISIKQTPAALTIERTLSTGNLTTVYKLDGSESVNTSGSVTSHTKSHWTAGKLITEGTRDVGDIHGTIKETRWIDKDGTLVVESEIQREGNPAPVTSRQVYVKAK